MKVLLGVILAGSQKNYCVTKFAEQIDKVFKPADVDVAFVVDNRNWPGVAQKNINHVILEPRMDDSAWATEIVYYGKNALREYFLASDYDALIWQGIDCFYADRIDFERLLQGAERSNAQIYGALVAGRNRADYPVCRSFVFDTPSQKWTTTQKEMPTSLLSTARPTPVPGYIGSDATLLKRWILTHCTLEGYEHWHTRPNKDVPLAELGPEEYFMWEAITKYNSMPVCHTGIRPWHVHESGRAVRYPNQECDISDINYE